MLSPVSNHQTEPHDSEGQQEHKERGPRVDVPHGVVEHVAAQFPERRLERKERPALADEVERQVEPNEQVEAPDVLQELPHVIPLVANG